MNSALSGTDLNLPVNNLTTLASDYNWVEEMALLTRQGLPAALNIYVIHIYAYMAYICIYMAMKDRMTC